MSTSQSPSTFMEVVFFSVYQRRQNIALCNKNMFDIQHNSVPGESFVCAKNTLLLPIELLLWEYRSDTSGNAKEFTKVKINSLLTIISS